MLRPERGSENGRDALMQGRDRGARGCRPRSILERRTSRASRTIDRARPGHRYPEELQLPLWADAELIVRHPTSQHLAADVTDAFEQALHRASKLRGISGAIDPVMNGSVGIHKPCPQ